MSDYTELNGNKISGSPMRHPNGSGEWGVLIPHASALAIDDTCLVHVAAKNGKRWTANYKVVGVRGDGVAFATKVAGSGSSNGSRRYRRSDSPTYVSCRDAYASRKSANRLACDRHNTYGCDAHLW